MDAGVIARVETLRRRALAFVRFLWHRFLDENCFEAAGALSFTTVFALVPLTTAALGIATAFPGFKAWSDAFTQFIFANFVPSAAQAMQGYLLEFVSKASQLTTAGVVALIVSALVMMWSVEESFNRVFRAPAHRRRLARFVVYWTVITLGPILIGASLGLSTYLFNLPWLDAAARDLHLGERLLLLLPLVVTWFALALAFLVIPNATVRFRHAALGALAATVLFELSKRVFAAYLARTNYEQIYQALAVVPIFLFWVYVFWVIVLIGASLAASLSAFRFHAAAAVVGESLTLALLVRTVRHIAEATRLGASISRNALHGAEPALSDAALDRILDLLRGLHLVQRTETGDYVLVRDPASVRVADLFAADPRLRWPVAAEFETFERVAGPEDAALCAWLRTALDGQGIWLQRTLAELMAPNLSAQAQSKPA
jgi:membrane protein